MISVISIPHFITILTLHNVDKEGVCFNMFIGSDLTRDDDIILQQNNNE